MGFLVDIFCRVVDNFGDVGVSWRLAKQFAARNGFSVRYIVDNLEVFKRFAPNYTLRELDSSAQGCNYSKETEASMTCKNVVVMPWREDYLQSFYHEPAQLVLEMFGGGLPEHVIGRMVAKPTQWIDVQYLSAEEWVPRFHAIPSFDPSSNLERTLFFPGFGKDTGGLLREEALLARRDAFQSDMAAQNEWRSRFGLPVIDLNVIDASLFCYPDVSLEALLTAIEASPRPVRIFVTSGVHSSVMQRLRERRDDLNFYEVPFLSQDDYDQLLWSCDFNFVRGEDSWVRAIWSGKPFLWHIYRQDNDTHFRKLSAFLKVYTSQMEQTRGVSIEKLMFLWNEGEGKGFAPFVALESWAKQARDFVDQVALQSDLATRILEYVQQRMSTK